MLFYDLTLYELHELSKYDDITELLSVEFIYLFFFKDIDDACKLSYAKFKLKLENIQLIYANHRKKIIHIDYCRKYVCFLLR